METGAGTAGNGDEQCGEQGADLGSPTGECGDGKGCGAGECGSKDTNNGNDHHGIQQIAGQIVTGLQQYPHGDQRRNSDVNTDEDDPEDTVDFELTQFYDLCDNIGVWVSI